MVVTTTVVYFIYGQEVVGCRYTYNDIHGMDGQVLLLLAIDYLY